jgi:hypothetical protein
MSRRATAEVVGHLCQLSDDVFDSGTDDSKGAVMVGHSSTTPSQESSWQESPWQEWATTSISDVAWDTHTLQGSQLRPEAEANA